MVLNLFMCLYSYTHTHWLLDGSEQVTSIIRTPEFFVKGTHTPLASPPGSHLNILSSSMAWSLLSRVRVSSSWFWASTLFICSSIIVFSSFSVWFSCSSIWGGRRERRERKEGSEGGRELEGVGGSWREYGGEDLATGG